MSHSDNKIKNNIHRAADPAKWAAVERETDPHKIAQRQKQIDLGKNTLGYDLYVQAVPRQSRGKEHPRTPDVTRKCSKRAWAGLFTVWRRALHKYDPAGTSTDQAAESKEVDVMDLTECRQ